MNSPAEAFNNIFIEKGGRLTSMPRSLEIELGNNRLAMNMWREILTKNLKAKNMPTLYLDFIANPSFNAAATETDNYGLIGFNWATPVIIGDVFGRMFSHPKIFPDVGNASAEYLDPKWQYGISPCANDLTTRLWSGINMNEKFAWVSVPKDPLRLRVASLCCSIAWDFLCIHELAHIGYGHTTYLKDKAGMPFLLEADSPVCSTDVQITRQALEMSADAVAASSLDAFLRNRDQIIKSNPELKFLSDDKMAIFLWVFACGSLFFMLDPECDINSLESRSHPPTVVRLMCNINHALDNIVSGYDNTDGLFPKDDHAFTVTAYALSCIGEKVNAVKFSEQSRNDLVLREYTKDIVARFQSLRPELKPYSHFDLY